MKKLFVFYIGLLVIIGLPIQAAINVRLQGQIYSEISSRPGDELKAGNRIKLYSELAKVGPTTIKVRMWWLNQKADYLNRYDSSAYLRLDNIVDWAEVNLTGPLFPKGPSVNFSFGNVEVNYSPYIISLKDEGLNDYIFTYPNHRGIALQDLEILKSQCSSFILWGFGDPNKNAIGGQISKKLGNTELTGTILDYRYRTLDWEDRVKQELNNNDNLISNIGWQQVKGINADQNLGKVGSIRLCFVSQDQNVFRKVDNQVIQDRDISVLKEIEWELSPEKAVQFKVGYRDFPSNFDPILRDRTPEFDPITGHYLGYNPLDRNKGLKGTYLSICSQKENVEFNALVEGMKNDRYHPDQYNNIELGLKNRIRGVNFDIYTSCSLISKWLETGISNILESNFTRAIVTYPIFSDSSLLMVSGLELRRLKLDEKNGERGTLFFQYKKDELLALEVGLRQAISGKATTGYYLTFDYRTPSGLVFNYRYSWPVIFMDGKKHYDPDYRLIEEANIVKLSAKVNF